MKIDHTKYKAHGIGKKRSRHNDDEVARLLVGIAVVDLENLTALTGSARCWPNLNAGQRTMNARNVLRMWVSKDANNMAHLEAAVDKLRALMEKSK